MIGSQQVSETLAFNPGMTQLTAWERFREFVHRESFKLSCIKECCEQETPSQKINDVIV